MNCRYTRSYAHDNEINAGPTQDEQGGSTVHRKEVTLDEMKILLWDEFEWDEEGSPVEWGGFMHSIMTTRQQAEIHHPSSYESSDEVKLFRVIDYLHLQPYDEIICKIWAMKILHCPCFLEESLRKRGFIRSRVDDTYGEVVEMYIEKIPAKNEEPMWRFLLSVFMSRLIFASSDEPICRDESVDETMLACDVLTQLTFLCSGLGDTPESFMREMITDHKLLQVTNQEECRHTSLDDQVLNLWKLLKL